MQDASLQAQLLESKAEITRLRERLSTGTPTVHKDVTHFVSAEMVRLRVSCLVRRVLREYRKRSKNRQVACVRLCKS
jgi:hypothetical protein